MIESSLLGAALLLALRWAHVLAALAWVGGALFYLLVLRPSLSAVPGEARSAVERTIGQAYQEVVQTSIVVLVVSGAVLSFDRLTAGVVGASYVVILGLKIALSLVMFWLAWELGRRRREGINRQPAFSGPTWVPEPVRIWLGPARLTLSLGLVVVLLGLLLRALYEAALRAGA